MTVMTLDEFKNHSATKKPRVMIRPRAVVQVKTPEHRRAVGEAARRVIEEHREVLIALKDR